MGERCNALGDSGKAWQRALILLCSRFLDSLVSPHGQPCTGGSRFLPKSALKPCGCMVTHPSCGWPPSHVMPFLPGHQPLFFRSCSYRGLDTKPQSFLPFPHAQSAGALGQCASPSWTLRPHRATRGTSNLTGCIVSLWCSQGLAGPVCLCPRDGQWAALQLQQLYTKELHPS